MVILHSQIFNFQRVGINDDKDEDKDEDDVRPQLRASRLLSSIPCPSIFPPLPRFGFRGLIPLG